MTLIDFTLSNARRLILLVNGEPLGSERVTDLKRYSGSLVL